MRGASRDVPTSWLAHDVARQCFDLRTRVWFEYVESAANIADLPSRGDARLAARLLRERFGKTVWVREMQLPPLRAAPPA